jgi:hypothetical protein
VDFAEMILVEIVKSTFEPLGIKVKMIVGAYNHLFLLTKSDKISNVIDFR